MMMLDILKAHRDVLSQHAVNVIAQIEKIDRRIEREEDRISMDRAPRMAGPSDYDQIGTAV